MDPGRVEQKYVFINVPDVDYDADDEKGKIMRTKTREG